MSDGDWLIVIRSPDDRIHSLRCRTESTKTQIVGWLLDSGFKKQDIFWTFDAGETMAARADKLALAAKGK
jgi:hypothetical protein